MPTGSRLIERLFSLLMLLSISGCSLNITRPAMSGKVVDLFGKPVVGVQIQTIVLRDVPVHIAMSDANGYFHTPRHVAGIHGPGNTFFQTSFRPNPMLLVTTTNDLKLLYWSRSSWTWSRADGPTRRMQAPDLNNVGGDGTLSDRYPEIRGATNVFLSAHDWPLDNKKIVLRLIEDEKQ